MPAYYKNHDALPGLLRLARGALKTYRKFTDEKKPKLAQLANEARSAYMNALAEYLSERLCRGFPDRHVGWVDAADAQKFVDLTAGVDLSYPYGSLDDKTVVEKLAEVLGDRTFSDVLDRKGV